MSNCVKITKEICMYKQKILISFEKFTIDWMCESCILHSTLLLTFAVLFCFNVHKSQLCYFVNNLSTMSIYQRGVSANYILKKLKIQNFWFLFIYIKAVSLWKMLSLTPKDYLIRSKTNINQCFPRSNSLNFNNIFIIYFRTCSDYFTFND